MNGRKFGGDIDFRKGMTKLVGVGRLKEDNSLIGFDAEIKRQGSQWKGYMMKDGTAKPFLWGLPLEVSSSG